MLGVRKAFAVMDGVSSRILDSQIYSTESNAVPDKLLFQVDLAPGETRTFYILDSSALAAVPPPIVKTFARYVPERMDDFAWESDRIAHRIYGQALIKGEGTITSGIDVWIKTWRNLMVNEMYASGHYHMDNGDENGRLPCRQKLRRWRHRNLGRAKAPLGDQLPQLEAHHHRPDPLGI